MVADFFIRHIADGVDVYHERHGSNHHHHQRGEAVHQEADREIQPVHGQPGIDVFIKLGTAAVDKPAQHIGRQHGGYGHAEYGNRVRAPAADGVAEQPGQQTARQGREGDDKVESHVSHVVAILTDKSFNFVRLVFR